MKADILLVEDSLDDAELATRVIRSYDKSAVVRVASDGSDALAFLFDEQGKVRVNQLPRLILLDIKMARLSGIEVLRQIRASEATRCIPVVMLTSSNQQRDINECYRLGASSYLVKPIDYREYSQMLLDAVRYWLNYNASLPA